MIQLIASDEVLELAYQWLCRQRRHASHNHDVWRLRANWSQVKQELKQSLLSGTLRLGCTRRYEIEGKSIEVWEAVDALVLKAIAIVLGRDWNNKLSLRCFHLAGRGGSKAAVRELSQQLTGDRHFVFRTDVKRYYASIDHDILLEQLRQFVDDPLVRDILKQYVRHSMNDAGIYEDVVRGISLGCPLSPLMGALYLHPIDKAMEAHKVFYARFMDDWVIVTRSRWKLRNATGKINRILNRLKIEKHPDKTFVGREAKGFDFLGYHFTPGKLRVADKTVANFVARTSKLAAKHKHTSKFGKRPSSKKHVRTRLDERASQDFASQEVELYVQRFIRWTSAGLQSIRTKLESFSVDDDTVPLPLTGLLPGQSS